MTIRRYPTLDEVAGTVPVPLDTLLRPRGLGIGFHVEVTPAGVELKA